MKKTRMSGLGKGLDSLIPKDLTAPEEESGGGLKKLPLSQIEPNRGQPRREFSEEALKDLAASISQYGILQPLLVQKQDDHYVIVAGERRWRAARMAGLSEAPVNIVSYSPQQTMEVALIENLQREDLTPLEEAAGYDELLRTYHLKQEELAERLGKSRTAVTNALRLLKLPASIQKMVADGSLSAGHARALLALDSAAQMKDAAEIILHEGMSVRGAEDLVRRMKEPAPEKKPAKKAEPVSDSVKLAYRETEEKLTAALLAQVRIRRAGEQAGKIEIAYHSLEELERLTYELSQRGAKGRRRQ